MEWYATIDVKTALLLLIVFGCLLIGSAFMMSMKHPREVYLIFYLHSLFVLVFLGLEIVAQHRGIGLADVCGSYVESCKTIHHALTDFNEERWLVLIAFALIVLPQLATYIFSGVFGCALQPLFVTTALKVAFWSIIKFLAGLGGTLTAHPLATLLLLKPVTLGEFVPGVAVTAYAFAYGAALVFFELGESWLRKTIVRERSSRFVRALVKTHRAFTRNRIIKPNASPRFVEVHVHLPELSQLSKLSDRVPVQTYLHFR